MCGLGNRKQEVFLELAADGVPVSNRLSPGTQTAGRRGRTAIYSSGHNSDRVLKAAGIADLFTVRVDGVVAEELGLSGKPGPAVSGCRASCWCAPERSVVVEDAEASVKAGRSGGFALVIGVDRTGHGEELLQHGADVVVDDLAEVDVRTGDKRMSTIRTRSTPMVR